MEIDHLKNILEEFLTAGTDYLWFIEHDVHFDGSWAEFQNSFETSDADLLATEVRTRLEDPDWNWWATFGHEDHPPSPDTGVAALLPLIRVSRDGAKAVLAGLAAGWSGHPEALLPTLIHEAGLKIEDIGGHGSFTPEDRLGRWYDGRTWHWSGPVGYVPGFIHFPVPQQRRALAPGRIAPPTISDSPRILYVSPVGGGAADLLPDVLSVFRKAGADILLLQYDSADLDLPPDVRVIRDRGYKWQLAVRHLHPDSLTGYDYIFFWDDDLGAAGFDPDRFISIMRTNRLEMAQPSIRSPHGLSHAITRHRACPRPFRCPKEGKIRPVVGRLTNFVEIMAPVYTRESWREFYGYLDPDNRSGWGYDYIPLGRKGIVDALPVIHTRAVQSINHESETDIKRFMDDQGIFRHEPVDHGWLFE